MAAGRADPGRAAADPSAEALLGALAAVVERLPDAALLTRQSPPSHEHRVVCANDAFAALAGLAVDDLRGQTPPVAPRAEAAAEAASEMLARKREVRLEANLHLPEGRTVPVLLDLEPLSDVSGEPLWLWSVTPDAARQPEVDFRRLFDECPLGIVVFDAGDRFTYCNPAYRAILSRNAHLLRPGMRFEDICRAAAASGHICGVSTDEAERWVEERLARHRACGEPFEEVLNDGRVLMTREVRLADGGILGIRTDITGIHRRDQALLDSLGEGFAIFDSNDRLVVWNARYADFCHEIEHILTPGVTFEEIVRARSHRGQYVLDEVPDDDQEGVIARRLQRHREGRGETVLQLGDGRWLLVRDRRAGDGSYSVAATDVTRLKEAEAAARYSEERLTALLEASSDWFWETDAEHRFTRIERGEEMFGAERIRQMMGARRWELDQDATPAQAWAEYIAHVEHRRAFRNFRFSRTREDGRVHHYEVSGKPVYGEDGAFLGYRGIGTDVTAEVEAERRASAAQSLLEAAIESIEEAFAIFDSDDRLVMVNSKWREIHAPIAEHIRPGLSFREHIRHFVEAGMIPEVVGREEEWIEWRSSGDRRDGTKYLRQFGEGRWFIVRDYRLPDGATVCVRTDVTELKNNEERLAELAMIAERTDDAVMTTDAEHRITWVNQSFIDMTGYAPADLLGKTPFETFLAGPGIDLEAKDAVYAARRQGRSYEMEVENRRKDGSLLWVQVSATPIRDGNGAIQKWLTISRDITRQKAAARLLAEARDEAERASRAKSAFLANMSHELKTPLNAIIGFSEMMRDETFGPLGSDRYREYVAGIHDSGTHFLDLINGILDFSRADAGLLTLEEQSVDIVALVGEALSMMRARADRGGIVLRQETVGGMPRLRADSRKVQQILLNLLSNAVKFTPVEGEVVVRVDRADDGDVVVSVKDTGIGMAPNEIPRAFAAFGQVDNHLDRRFEGTGLGLPLTRKLVELHGGSITLESAVGAGTTATVRLPAARCMDAPPARGGTDGDRAAEPR